MPGPAPKDPSARARRNKSSTRATLTADHEVATPDLPESIAWHELTRKWWADLWSSPMATEYAKVDQNGLLRVAMILNDFWTAETPKERAEAQVRLEKADADFGTNPLARRRLEWQIEATEEAKGRGRKRTERTKDPAKPADPASDPRNALYVVS